MRAVAAVFASQRLAKLSNLLPLEHRLRQLVWLCVPAWRARLAQRVHDALQSNRRRHWLPGERGLLRLQRAWPRRGDGLLELGHGDAGQFLHATQRLLHRLFVRVGNVPQSVSAGLELRDRHVSFREWLDEVRAVPLTHSWTTGVSGLSGFLVFCCPLQPLSTREVDEQCRTPGQQGGDEVEL